MMNQEDIFKKIGQILNELQDQYEFLAQNPKQLNELELELFLANANFLSDHVQIIRKINNSNKPVKELPEHFEVEEEEIKAQEIVVPEMTSAPQEEKIPEPSIFEFIYNESQATDKFDFEAESIEPVYDRPFSKEEEEIILQKRRLMEAQQAREIEEKRHAAAQVQATVLPKEEVKIVQPEVFVPVTAPVVQHPLNEQVQNAIPVTPVTPVANVVSANPVPQPAFKVEEKISPAPATLFNAVPEKEQSTPAARPTLNELLAGKNSQPNNINQESTKPAVTDLKQAINLNEKLLYIKDLFNGYNLAYAEAIDLINKMPDLKTADAFLQNNYAEKNNWQAKQSTVDKFYALLGQRFQD